MKMMLNLPVKHHLKIRINQCIPSEVQNHHIVWEKKVLKIMFLIPKKKGLIWKKVKCVMSVECMKKLVNVG